ncbi:MAG: hypothetical protein JW722_07825 [Demequinaceae bacterium]|nr:hypothetical protein [Demequinaceae bacterium]
MTRRTAARVWNGLLLAFAILPLAIFWSGRNGVFQPDDGAADGTLSGHVWASALYLTALGLIVAWLRARGQRVLVLGLLALASLAGTAVVFWEIGEDAVQEAGVSGLGFDVSIVIIVYLAAGMAAWLLLWSVVTAVRKHDRR